MPGADENSDAAPLSAECLALPPFDARDLDAARGAFETAGRIPMRQAWLAKEEPDFAPGAVRVGWSNDSLLLLAELADEDIFTRADGLNQRLWELGDAFEIFLRPVKQSAYAEFQIAPNNERLQLRYPDAEAVHRAREASDFGPYLISGEAFRSAAWVLPAEKKWFAFASIPAGSVCDEPGPLTGRQWRFSFSRYERARNRHEPVISSTSPHSKPEFHRQKDWGVMTFLPRI